MVASLLQVAGLLLFAVGLYIWFGVGPALVAAGASATAVGLSVEIDRRRT